MQSEPWRRHAGQKDSRRQFNAIRFRTVLRWYSKLHSSCCLFVTFICDVHGCQRANRVFGEVVQAGRLASAIREHMDPTGEHVAGQAGKGYQRSTRNSSATREHVRMLPDCQRDPQARLHASQCGGSSAKDRSKTMGNRKRMSRA